MSHERASWRGGGWTDERSEEGRRRLEAPHGRANQGCRMSSRLAWAALLLAVGAVQVSVGWAGWVPAAVLVAAAVAPLGVLASGARLGLPAPLVVGTVVALGLG